jgi:hypothetical protein
MNDTMPERTATKLELAREAARMTPCACGARAGYTCDGKGGMHLARFAEARRAGLMPEDRMAAVLGDLDVLTPMTIVGGAR